MHRLRRGRTRLLVVFGALAWLIPGAGTAYASCVEPPPIGRAVDEGDIVFVGTVTAVTNSDRWATVAVEEIWKGGDIDPVVEIKAGPADPPGQISAVSSVDRTFQDGERYLFFPYRTKFGTLRDSSCSNTTRFTPELERFRPASAREPFEVNGSNDVVEPNRWWVPFVIGAPGVVVLGLALVVFARRRVTD